MASVYYDPEKSRTPWVRIIFIITSILFVLFLVFLIFHLNSVNSKDIYNDFYYYAKQYFYDNPDNYPEEIGDCKKITLNELINAKAIKNVRIFKKYDGEKSSLTICKLKENDYQYTPILTKNDETTLFDDWTYGNVEDLKQGNSDVQVLFIPEVLKNGIKYYYPNNLQEESSVIEFYSTLPSDEYVHIDTPSLGYKWTYKEEQKEYYNDGEKVSEKPEGFEKKEEKEIKAYASLIKPEEKEYRNFEETTIYSYEYVSYPYKYECIDTNIVGYVTSSTLCEARNSSTFKKTKKIYYTCDGINEVDAETICKNRSEWMLKSCYTSSQTKDGKTNDGYNYKRQVSTGYTCISTKGYKVNDEVYKWYNTDEVKLYYPSKEKESEKEITYYVKNPVSQAQRNDDTKSLVFKYYKFLKNQNEEKTWVSLTDKVLTKEEMFELFKKNNFDVKSLKEINDNNNIGYQIILMYRNRK